MTGKAILQLALKHLGEPYVLGKVAPKNDPKWEGPWDCAEFVSWCVYQVAGILFGCFGTNPKLADAFTGKWGEDARKKGGEISVNEAAQIPGAAVLRLGPKMGHIVISDGQGGTVEAHSAGAGVIRHTLSERRWDMGIIVPGIDYEVGPQVHPTQPGKIWRLTDPMMVDPEIQSIQMALHRHGFDPGPWDMVYGPRTFNAVRGFQMAKQLLIDGEVGPQTIQALGVR